jgi:hypothetical protein
MHMQHKLSDGRELAYAEFGDRRAGRSSSFMGRRVPVFFIHPMM